jgi:hypothetical protein
MACSSSFSQSLRCGVHKKDLLHKNRRSCSRIAGRSPGRGVGRLAENWPDQVRAKVIPESRFSAVFHTSDGAVVTPPLNPFLPLLRKSIFRTWAGGTVRRISSTVDG